jgi:glucose/arabinose dehydrogenase
MYIKAFHPTIKNIKNIRMKSILIYVTAIVVLYFTGCHTGHKPAEASYRIEDITLPQGLGGQVGGLDFLPDGRLAACFSSGEVMFYDPQKKTWHLFATGLHDPLGILAESKDTVLVMQRPELTRIIDNDHDGTADEYQTVTNKFGISGNYHEFAYGPVKDKAGNLYIALNCASDNQGVMKEVRGGLNKIATGHPKGMYSPVPYRGWIMQYTTDNKLVPYAYGFRSPNGLGFDLNGNLFATDNQGDWVPTSTLYLIKKDQFYGHPASLAWKKGWRQGDPSKLPPAQLDSMRTKAIVLFPQDIEASSPTQPLIDNTQGEFGPFEGQFFVGEMNSARILRVMLEKINGQLQGACIPFIDNQGLHKGNNRLAFAPDGSLWIGQNDHGWVGDRGIQRISFTGNTPLDILHMHLTRNGFDLTFTLPLNADSAVDKQHYKMRHYNYHYSAKYGSPQFNVKEVPITSIHLSDDRKTVLLVLDTIQPDLIYELTLTGIRSAEEKPLRNNLICYTVNQLNSGQ